MNNGKLLTGSPELNKVLACLGGLNPGDLSGEKALLLNSGIDVITQDKTFLRREKFARNAQVPLADMLDVYVVFSEKAGIGKGLFFATYTLAEVHFSNITGAHKVQCNEQSGGRTLAEMMHHLFDFWDLNENRA